MKIQVETSGSFDNLERWLKKMRDGDIYASLSKYGEEGVRALSAATPKESGETAAAWTYEIKRTKGTYSIIWSNTHVVGTGTPVAILLQYGHGTGTGGYVQGRDYINPAMRPIFDRMANEAWKVVTSR